MGIKIKQSIIDALNAPRIAQEQALAKRQELLNKFGAMIPQYEQEMLQEARRGISGQLKQNIGTLNKNASQRGLLYSGQRSKNQAELEGGAALDVATQRNEIAKQLKNQYESMKNDQTGLVLGSAAGDLENQRNSILQQMQANQSKYQNRNQLMQGIGYGASNLYDSYQKRKDQGGGGGSPSYAL